jgi:hypothetical protein
LVIEVIVAADEPEPPAGAGVDGFNGGQVAGANVLAGDRVLALDFSQEADQVRGRLDPRGMSFEAGEQDESDEEYNVAGARVRVTLRR